MDYYSDIREKVCLLRVDFNVPVVGGEILDYTRIDSIMPTVMQLLDNSNKIIFLSHFGRPKGKFSKEYSLKFLCPVLEERFGEKVFFLDSLDREILDINSDYRVFLLENLRFHAGEESNDLVFAKHLASLGDVYINDAFSVSHRKHASVVGVREFLPSYLGREVMHEVDILTGVLNNPDRPMVGILSGAKVSTKLGVIKGLLEKVDYLLLAGGIATTFLCADGISVGKSIVEDSMLGEARELLSMSSGDGNIASKIVLPMDFVVATSPEAGVSKVVSFDSIPDGMSVFDIGPRSISIFKDIISRSRSLIWNGPLGMFEVSPYDRATNELANHIAFLTKEGSLFSVAGGGETVAAISSSGVQVGGFSHLSTAGGAFLEFCEGKSLPGIW